MNKFDEQVNTFDKQELKYLFVDKINEFNKPCLPRYTKAQRAYLVFRMGKDAGQAIHLGEFLKKKNHQEELAYWCKQYLRLTDEPKTGGLSSETIQRAREYPTNELYEGKLIRSGRNFKCKCPFHEERTPSFQFYADGSYYCFGCNVSGQNAIDYVMNLDKVDFVAAVGRLV